MYQHIHMYVQETKTAIGLESDKYIKVQSALEVLRTVLLRTVCLSYHANRLLKFPFGPN